MKFKLLFFLIFALVLNLPAQVQQQTRHSIDDVMKKLETMDNSFRENVETLRTELDQKLNQSANQIRDEIASKIEKINSRLSSLSSATEQVERRIANVEAQNRNLRNRISKVEDKVSGVEAGITEVKNSIGEVNSGVKEVSSKIEENATRFDEILSKIGTNRATFIIGFIIVIIFAVGITIGVVNLSRLTKSVEKNILDSFENTSGKIEVTTNDLKTLVDVLKQQTSEIIAYQKIIEERITAAQQQLEAKLAERLAPRRGRTRKASEEE